MYLRFKVIKCFSRFFPLTQKIEVASENIMNLVFSQLKSTISGRVDCIQKQDCEGLNVIMKSGSEELVILVQGKFIVYVLV